MTCRPHKWYFLNLHRHLRTFQIFLKAFSFNNWYKLSLLIECIFLSQGRHYDSSPVFTFIRYQLVFDWFSTLRNSSQGFEVIYKRMFENLLNLKLKFGYEIEFAFNLEGFLKCFLKKCLGSACYFMVCQGVLFLEGLKNKYISYDSWSIAHDFTIFL